MDKDLRDKAKALLSKKEEFSNQLSVATAKVKELSEQLDELEPEIKETFGTTDLAELEKIAAKLVEEAEEILEQIK